STVQNSSSPPCSRSVSPNSRPSWRMSSLSGTSCLPVVIVVSLTMLVCRARCDGSQHKLPDAISPGRRELTCARLLRQTDELLAALLAQRFAQQSAKRADVVLERNIVLAGRHRSLLNHAVLSRQVRRQPTKTAGCLRTRPS